MKIERAKHIINAFIDNYAIARNPKEVIQHCLFIGLTKKELINEFNFTETDVTNAEEDMNNYEDS